MTFSVCATHIILYLDILEAFLAEIIHYTRTHDMKKCHAFLQLNKSTDSLGRSHKRKQVKILSRHRLMDDESFIHIYQIDVSEYEEFFGKFSNGKLIMLKFRKRFCER
jgi:hypothetical protein